MPCTVYRAVGMVSVQQAVSATINIFLALVELLFYSDRYSYDNTAATATAAIYAALSTMVVTTAGCGLHIRV